MNSAIEVRGARPEEFEALAETLVIAFRRDPLAHWLFPDPIERDRRHRELFDAALREPNDAGRIHTVADLSAVAIWRPRTGRTVLPPAVDLASTSDRFFRAVDAAAPTVPYLNLEFLGSRVSGTGAGGALLRHGIAAAPGPVALWTGNQANLAFYQHYGFSVSSHVGFDGADAWWLTKDLPY